MPPKRTKSKKVKSPKGFSEEGAAYAPPAMPARTYQTVELGAGGRLVIPAPMREALGMKIGERLTVQIDGNQLRIYTYEEGIRQAQAIVRKYLPKGVDPLEDFLRWKREQAALEQAKLDK
jgi:bifunctional DNA-binding transcriptional regulator/antitoxin component of YhaV-PrlF toxin-antitoxin module